MSSCPSPEIQKTQLLFFFLVIWGLQCFIHLPSLFYILQSNYYLIVSLYTHFPTLHFIQYSLNYVLTYYLYWLCASLILIFPIYLLTYLKFLRHFITTLSMISSFLGIIFLWVDQNIYEHFQFHLSKNFLNLLEISELPYFLHLSTLELTTILTISLAFLCLLIFAYKKCYSLASSTSTQMNLWHIVGLTLIAIFLYLFYLHQQLKPSNRHIIANQMDYYFGIKPFLKRTPLQQGIQSATESRAFARLNHSLPILKRSIQKNDLKSIAHPPNIVWILVDTLRYDYLTPQYMPYSSAFAKKSQVFQQHISSGNSTQPGFFGLFYGLPPSYFSSTVTHHTPPMLFDVLQAMGYQFKIFWSGTIHCPPFIKNVFAHLPRQDVQITRIGDVIKEDRRSSDYLVNFLKQHNQKKPFFSVILLTSVHGYCNTEQFTEKPYQSCYRFHLNKTSDPTPLIHRYQLATRFVDERIHDILKQIDLKNTIVLITSDHGESFNDYHNNLWGHANAFTPNLIHVPLVIYWPNQAPKEFKKITTHYDVSHTFMQYFSNLNDKQLEPYNFGQSLYAKQSPTQVLLGSYVHTAIWDIHQQQVTILHPDGELSIKDMQNNPIHKPKPSIISFKEILFLMSKFYQRN